MRARSVLAASAAAITIFATATSALADNITNTLDTTVDSVVETMPLIVGGSGSTLLAVVPTKGDNKNGCNLTGKTTLVVDVASSDASVATVTPNRITFDSCGATPTLSVKALKVGWSTISLKEYSNSTGRLFDFGPAVFNVNVIAPGGANTPPSVGITGVSDGASFPKGSVPTATCAVSDAEDGASIFAATLSAVDGPYASDGIGSQTATCSYTDKGGLKAMSSVTYSIIDESAPAISYVLSPADPDGLAGWYRSDVSLTWTVAEPESPNSLKMTGCVNTTITSDQFPTDYSCSATSAGGAPAQQTVSIKRDATAPTVANASAPSPDGQNGWYVSPVTATFVVSDATSGPAQPTVSATSPTGAEGSGVVVDSPQASDLAGNVAPAGAASQSFQIDLTAPTATMDSSFADSYYFGEVPAAPTCTAHDSVSGPESCAVSGYSTAVGTHTLVATAKDVAGWSSATPLATYTVKAWTIFAFYQPVDMGGVWNTVKGGSTVPLKFEVFAGTKELTDPSIVSKFTVNKVTCAGTTATEDAIEQLVTTGGTSPRYDTTAGQFIQNWQTPKSPGTCYSVKVTTVDGTSSNLALFKLK